MGIRKNKNGLLVRYIITVFLVVLCPVFASDFLISAGLLPISYIFFYSILWFHPIMFIYLFISCIYGAVFFFAAKLFVKFFEKKSKLLHSVAAGLLLFLTMLSSQPVYIDFGDDFEDKKNLISLFSDQYIFWAGEQKTEQFIKQATIEWERKLAAAERQAKERLETEVQLRKKAIIERERILAAAAERRAKITPKRKQELEDFYNHWEKLKKSGRKVDFNLSSIEGKYGKPLSLEVTSDEEAKH